MNREVGSRRIEYIDALRAIAALSVLVVHIAGYLTRQPESPWLAQEFRRLVLEYFDLGLFGVALFFFISGFVVPPSLLRSKSLPQFWIFRVFRLYPLYWISLIVVFLVDGLVLGREFFPTQIAANATMAPQLFGETPISGVYWTLFVELVVYVFVTILYSIKLLGSPRVIASLVVSLAAIAAVPVAANNYLHTTLPTPFLALHLSYLFAGYLVRLALHECPTPRRWPLIITLLLHFVLAVVATDALGDSPRRFGLFSNQANLLAYTAASLVFLWSVKTERPRSLILLNIGRASFSLYLLHWPVIIVFIYLISNVATNAGYLALIIGAILSIGLSELSYRQIELRFVRIGNRFWYGQEYFKK